MLQVAFICRFMPASATVGNGLLITVLLSLHLLTIKWITIISSAPSHPDLSFYTGKAL